MIIPGHRVKETELVKDAPYASQFQPAGVDLTLKSIFSFSEAGCIDGDNAKRRLPKTTELVFPAIDAPLHLSPGTYKVIFNELVKIPHDAIALTFPRSSLLRMGASMHNAVWDPGYEGRGEAMLLVANSHGLDVHKNAKLVQMVFVRMESAASSTYSGKYMHENK